MSVKDWFDIICSIVIALFGIIYCYKMHQIYKGMCEYIEHMDDKEYIEMMYKKYFRKEEDEK